MHQHGSNQHNLEAWVDVVARVVEEMPAPDRPGFLALQEQKARQQGDFKALRALREYGTRISSL